VSIDCGAEQISKTTKAGVMLKRLITLAIIAASLALPAVALAAGAHTSPAVHVVAVGDGDDINTHWGWDETGH
jgi:hypothetical protein